MLLLTSFITKLQKRGLLCSRKGDRLFLFPINKSKENLSLTDLKINLTLKDTNLVGSESMMTIENL